MSRLVIKTDEETYILFCNTMDAIISPPLKDYEMIHYLETGIWRKDFGGDGLNQVMRANSGKTGYTYKECKEDNKNSGWNESEKLQAEIEEISRYYSRRRELDKEGGHL